jgi:hypothetical protein
MENYNQEPLEVEAVDMCEIDVLEEDLLPSAAKLCDNCSC